MNRKRRVFPRLGLEKAALSDRELEALVNTPEYYDEESFGGSMPNPEADDDVLKSEQEFGFYTEIETPQQAEINMQKQLNKAERGRRRRRDAG
jgi:hypothetical protein